MATCAVCLRFLSWFTVKVDKTLDWSRFQKTGDNLYEPLQIERGVKELNKHNQSDIKNKRTTNGFLTHLRKHKGHLIDWDEAVLLDGERDWKEDQGSFVHQCSESGKGRWSKEDYAFGKGFTLEAFRDICMSFLFERHLDEDTNGCRNVGEFKFWQN